MSKKIRYAGPSAQAHADVENGGLVVYYSYSTPIAFTYQGGICVTSQKYSVTTSKHMSKAIRHAKFPDEYLCLEEEAFHRKLREVRLHIGACEQFGLAYDTPTGIVRDRMIDAGLIPAG